MNLTYSTNGIVPDSMKAVANHWMPLSCQRPNDMSDVEYPPVAIEVSACAIASKGPIPAHQYTSVASSVSPI